MALALPGSAKVCRRGTSVVVAQALQGRNIHAFAPRNVKSIHFEPPGAITIRVATEAILRQTSIALFCERLCIDAAFFWLQ
jgi:hypothetical protein